MTLGEIAVLAAEALEEAEHALAGEDDERATAYALVSIAATLYLESARRAAP